MLHLQLIITQLQLHLYTVAENYDGEQGTVEVESRLSGHIICHEALICPTSATRRPPGNSPYWLRYHNILPHPKGIRWPWPT